MKPGRTIAAVTVLSVSWWIVSASAEDQPAIGYASVAAALQALRADPTATERSQQGWTVFEKARGLEFWTFTPESHPAYPSAARRIGYQDESGAWRVETRILCEAPKAHCDALMEEYRQLDAQMRENIRRRHGSGT